MWNDLTFFKFFMSYISEISCKWVANIKLDCNYSNFNILAATIAFPEICSVPLHISSPITNDVSLAYLNIFFNSVISNAKDDYPLNILSFPVILVCNDSYGEYSYYYAGT